MLQTIYLVALFAMLVVDGAFLVKYYRLGLFVPARWQQKRVEHKRFIQGAIATVLVEVAALQIVGHFVK